MNQRLLGLDLIRLLCFVGIVVFHSTWVIWKGPFGPPDPLPTAIWTYALLYARVFAFSGFVIVFLTSFLIGTSWGAERKCGWGRVRTSARISLAPKLYFILGAWLTFCLCVYLREGVFHLMWDVYPLLFVGIVSGRTLLRFPSKRLGFFVMIAGAMLSVPFWTFSVEKLLPFWWGEVFFGHCPEDYADWPLLPWIGLVWLGMIGGKTFAEKLKESGGSAFRFRKSEWLIWGPGLCMFIVFSDAYFHTLLGDGWACYTFRQSPPVFWGHFLFWAFLVRLSFHPRVQRFLNETRLFTWVSHLAISRSFYLAYLTHFLLIFALVGLLDPQQKAEAPWVLNAILLLNLPLTEILVRFVPRGVV